MNEQTERRQHPRQVLPTPDVGIVHPHYVGEERDELPGDGHDTLLVYLLNRSKSGFLLESLQSLDVHTEVDLWTRLPDEKDWQAFRGRVVWTEASPTESHSYLLGVESQGDGSFTERTTSGVEERKRKMYPSDLEFLITTPLLKAIPLEAKCPLLDRMTPQRVQAVTLFIFHFV